MMLDNIFIEVIESRDKEYEKIINYVQRLGACHFSFKILLTLWRSGAD